MSTTWIKEVEWKEHEAISFAAGGYEALIIPEVGANVVELIDTTRGISILRSPNEELSFKEFKERPQIYGLPLLFPPNRIEDGILKIDNKVYNLPINEPKNNNYIHGFVKNDKWEITRQEITENEKVEIEAVFNFDENHEFYKYLPLKFQLKLTYILSNEGLKQITTIINQGEEKIPVGIGYHSAFNIPFHPESSDDDCRIIASVDKRWEQNERNLPTENILELTQDENEYHNSGIRPLGYKIESHYSLNPIEINGSKFNGAIIEDISKGLRVVYEMGADYKHMVIWNDMGDKHYACIEPQTWVINAPNVNLDNEVTGFKTLPFGEQWSEVCRIFIDDIKK